jgi:hypothetical protein
MPAPLRHPAQVGKPGSNPASEVGLFYIPPATCFIPTQVNIYTGNGSIPVPGWNSADAGARNANVSGLITGNWLIGHRQLVTSNDNYTHVLLLDPSIEIRDPYTGIGQAPGSAPDAIEVLSEGVTAIKSGWRFVVMSGVADIPGLGRRKIVFLDQRSTYPTSTMAKDTFTDANTTELTSHIPDAGATAGWQFATGDVTIDNQGRAQIKPGSAADARALINIGQTWFTSGSCDVYVQPEPAATPASSFAATPATTVGTTACPRPSCGSSASPPASTTLSASRTFP